MTRFLLMFTAIILMGLTQNAQAQGMILGGAASYFKTGSNDGISGSNTNVSGTLFDVSFGMMFSSGFYLGAVYHSNTYTTESGASTSNGSLTGYGPRIGALISNFFLGYVYPYSMNYTPSDGSTYSKPTGGRYEIGYRFGGGAYSFGPTLAISDWSFRDLNGTDISSTPYKHTEQLLYFSLDMMM